MLKFYGAAQAYQWALEAASRPGLKSPSKLAMESLVENPRAGEFEREDILDTAYTVLATVKSIDPPAARLAWRVAFTHEREHDAQMQSTLAATILERFPNAGYSRCSRVAAAAVLTLRSDQLHGANTTMAFYAAALGMARQSANHWRVMIEATEYQLYEWFRQGKRQARTLLEEAGVVAG